MEEETDIVEPLSAEHVVAAEDITATELSEEQHRKKLLYQEIREVMEFYLGDTNINKDTFVSNKIKGKPFVYMDLSVFLTRYKMKQLTSSLEDVVKALSTSESLQVSEDGTQVCRKTPILKKENEEECTIYVEQLGPDMDYDLLTSVFSQFGPVDYVTMPRFSHDKFQGIAFVQFKDPESAKKALETFKEKGCCLSPDMAPEELMGIKNFDLYKENKTGDNIKVDRSVEKKEDMDNLIESTDSGDITNVSEESQSTKAEDCVNRVNDVGRGKKKRKCIEEVNSSCNATETAASLAQGEGEPMEEDAVVQKKRKEVKKDKPSAFSLGLKVLPKKEWRQLRNKYLNKQGMSMMTLKRHMIYSHKDHPWTLTPGKIIKVVLDEPVTNVQAVKRDMWVDWQIRFVDVREGSPYVYLRASTADVAASLVQAKHWPNMQVIQGQEEAEYYDRVKAIRERFFNKLKPAKPFLANP